MDEEFSRRYNQFCDDMRKEGLFISSKLKNEWKDPSFIYKVLVGTGRYLKAIPDSIPANFPLISDEGFLDTHYPLSTVTFHGDRSTPNTKRKKDYVLILPQRLDEDVAGLTQMSKGIHLLSTLEFWAFRNGRFDNFLSDKNHKKFILNRIY